MLSTPTRRVSSTEPRTASECDPTLVPDLPVRTASAKLTGTGEFPNEGRIEGASVIETFDYEVSGVGTAAICLDPDPPVDDPREVGLPAGPTDYVLTLLVGLPQAELSL
ncbi:hypothetical protein [Nocardiopsis lucentensis]|uniref:hypothetical protein n=1 Tax=Nocardiopsis lucentensis TaxID=53441 RepID=UPI000347372A|nr:hypothetical protein [Nocardiopsis lucentensis]